jgi:hypothetical protein
MMRADDEYGSHGGGCSHRGGCSGRDGCSSDLGQSFLIVLDLATKTEPAGSFGVDGKAGARAFVFCRQSEKKKEKEKKVTWVDAVVNGWTLLANGPTPRLHQVATMTNKPGRDHLERKDIYIQVIRHGVGMCVPSWFAMKSRQ